MPSSPPPRTRTLAPLKSVIPETISRAGPSILTPRKNEQSPAPTPAEAYATANRREKTKPLFEWFTRKLGGHRRNTFGESSRESPVNAVKSTLTPKEMFPYTSRENESILTPSDHSLRSYSMSGTPERERDRERRREMNNPYPNIPIPQRFPPTSISISVDSSRPPSTFARTTEHGSGSRTPSIRSEVSHYSGLRRSTFDDTSMLSRTFADEDASVRPIPPSPSSSSVYPRPPVMARDSISSAGPSCFSDGEATRSVTSTKPTTITSLESAPHIGHIAQVPLPISINPSSQTPTTPTPTQNGNMTVHPPSPLRTSGISAARAVIIQTTGTDPTTTSPNPLSPESTNPALYQAPKHTTPHPRSNPIPQAFPGDNASMITLASSTAGQPPQSGSVSVYSQSLHRLQPRQPGASPNIAWGLSSGRPASTYSIPPAHSFRTFAGSLHTTHTHGQGGLPDDDASIKAVRGRRGSWESGESGESGWSWRGKKVEKRGSYQSTPRQGSLGVGINDGFGLEREVDLGNMGADQSTYGRSSRGDSLMEVSA